MDAGLIADHRKIQMKLEKRLRNLDFNPCFFFTVFFSSPQATARNISMVAEPPVSATFFFVRSQVDLSRVASRNLCPSDVRR